jgi:hypothetical protein
MYAPDGIQPAQRLRRVGQLENGVGGEDARETRPVPGVDQVAVPGRQLVQLKAVGGGEHSAGCAGHGAPINGGRRPVGRGG